MISAASRSISRRIMMKIAGIVCEYNPFHEGHWLQISKLRYEHGVDAVICAMSGHFMQRGEPSVISKERRVKMALAGGADLVVELSALYATRSAYWFALGGVLLLAAAGATHIAFGAETDDLPAFQATAARLAKPDRLYTEALRRFLAAGLPFPEAQAKALNYGQSSGNSFAPALPNDRLALSYLQVIAEKGLSLEPILIPRSGSAYHETKLPENQTPGAILSPGATLAAGGLISPGGPASLSGLPPASATALRRRLQEGIRLYDYRKLSAAQLTTLGVAKHIPEASLPYLANTCLVFPADVAPIQMALLRRADHQALLALPDMTEGLENRIVDVACRAGSLEEFYRLLKTKRYPLTRLQRLVTHLLLDYREIHARHLAGSPPYLRVLGANSTGFRLLHQARKASPLPVISRTRQMKELIRQNPHAAAAWELEARSAALYSLISGSESAGGNPEYLFTPISL
ncbi:MAG: nucleotidyltransferase family protein [Clostridiales bacterium]